MAYALMASAIAGRSILVRRDGGAHAWTDRESIFVPDTVAKDEAVSAILVQASLINSGSLTTPATRSALRAAYRVASRFLTLEVARAVTARRHALPRSLVDRVDAICPDPDASAEASLRRADRARGWLPQPPQWFGQLAAISTEPPAGAAVRDRDLRRIDPSDELPELTKDEERLAERSRILEKLSAPAFRNPFATAFQRLLGIGRTKGDDAPPDDLPVGGHRFAPVGSAATVVARPSFLTTLFAAPAAPGHAYPEWDCHRGR
jgi:hypothetical protein